MAKKLNIARIEVQVSRQFYIKIQVFSNNSVLNVDFER